MPRFNRPRPNSGDGYHVLETSPALRLALACGTSGIDAFRRDPAFKAPGIYLSITRTGYVGCAEVSVTARTARLIDGSDAILALVGGDRLLDEDDAHALERIAFQAFDAAGMPLRNHIYPEGAPVGPTRYAALQLMWAETVRPLLEAAPALACPWTGPDYLVPPEEADEVEPLHTRWRGATGEADATLRTCGSGSGYVVEAGSRLRLDPIPSAPGLCQVMREELAYMGAIVREPWCWRLTRDLHLPTLAACARAVFTSGSSAVWRVERGLDAVAFEPAFSIDSER
jgi:hypothetical protein